MNSADLGGCYQPRPSASADNTLLDLQNSKYPTQPHSIIAKYSPVRLELTWLVSGLLYGTRAKLVLNLPAFENKKIYSL